VRKTKLSGDLPLPVGSRPYIVNTGEWRSQRPQVRSQLCKKCGSCYIHCPTQCIGEKVSHFEANLDYCKGCGICSYECPAFAIIMVDEEEEVLHGYRP
jgi:2-oxoacid:acceptor oxidoreductase delta subunit (pyruvate/2-ketoisovalerate family)